MPTDLTINLVDKPGTLADVGKALGKAGINLDGMCGFPCEGKGMFHILVEDAAAARSAMKGIGFEVLRERPVLIVEGEDRPGEFGNITRRIADAGVNVDLTYMATRSRLVIGADDLEKARTVIESHK